MEKLLKLFEILGFHYNNNGDAYYSYGLLTSDKTYLFLFSRIKDFSFIRVMIHNSSPSFANHISYIDSYMDIEQSIEILKNEFKYQLRQDKINKLL